MRTRTDERAASQMVEMLRPVIQSLYAEEGIEEPIDVVHTLNLRGFTTPAGGRWHIHMIQRSMERINRPRNRA